MVKRTILLAVLAVAAGCSGTQIRDAAVGLTTLVATDVVLPAVTGEADRKKERCEQDRDRHPARRAGPGRRRRARRVRR